MPGKAAKVTITERQQAVLEEMSRSRTEALIISQRASIILLAFAGRRNEEISIEVGLERKQVGLWRRRWRDAWEALTLLECLEPHRLREAVRETLRDAPRSGAPGTFTAEQITIAVQVIGYFNYIKRVAEGLGVEPELWMKPTPAEWRQRKAKDFNL